MGKKDYQKQLLFVELEKRRPYVMIQRSNGGMESNLTCKGLNLGTGGMVLHLSAVSHAEVSKLKKDNDCVANRINSS